MAGLSKADVLRIEKGKKVRFVRLWFTDFFGFLRSFAIIIRELEISSSRTIMIEWERYRTRVADHELEQYLSIL
jgi:glutamine synthetase